jgi:hypothetical protein
VKESLDILNFCLIDKVKKIDFNLDLEYPTLFFSNADKIIIPYTPFTPKIDKIMKVNIIQILLRNFEKLNETDKRGLVYLLGSAYWIGIKDNLETLRNDLKELSFEKIDERRMAFFSKIFESVMQKNLGDFLLKFYEVPKVLSNEGLSVKIAKEIRNGKRGIEIEEEKTSLKAKYKIDMINRDINAIYRSPFQYIFFVLYNEFKNPYLKRSPDVFNIFTNNIFYHYLHLLKEINDENAEMILKMNLKYLEKLEEIVNNVKFVAISFFGFDLKPLEQKSLIPLFDKWFQDLKEINEEYIKKVGSDKIIKNYFWLSDDLILNLEKIIVERIKKGLPPPDIKIFELYKIFKLTEVERKKLEPYLNAWEKWDTDTIEKLKKNKKMEELIEKYEFLKRMNMALPWTLLYIYDNHPRGIDPEFWEELLNVLREKKKIIEKIIEIQ